MCLYVLGPTLSRRVVEIIESDRSGNTPEESLSTFRPRVYASIYRTVASPMPASFWFDAPTVRLHGYYMGTDKIDHYFQQGHDYFKLVMRKTTEGIGSAEAIAAAVAHGVKQEHTYFGTLFSGVYSNSDLAANYAGMKFYLNLRHSVMIGNRLSPPLFEQTAEGWWRLRPGLDPDRILEPFLSNHLDESLNPGRYAFSRRSIRSRIRERCSTWTSFLPIVSIW